MVNPSALEPRAPQKELIVAFDSQSKAGIRLDIYLSETQKVSRSLSQEQIRSGKVSVNQSPIVKPSYKVREGDRIELEWSQNALVSERPPALVPVEGPLDILYEDEHLLAIHKPAGLVVHPGAGVSKPTLVHHLLHYFRMKPDFHSLHPERPGIVHRLDVGTSGVILVAKNRIVLEALGTQFRNRTVAKKYWALVWGEVPMGGTLDSAMGRDPRNRLRMSSQAQRKRTALTFYRRLGSRAPFSWVELSPKTGRTHQLRVHFSEFGRPIVGDRLYDKGTLNRELARLPTEQQTLLREVSRPLLHAHSISFSHPITGAVMTLTAEPPADFMATLKGLGF